MVANSLQSAVSIYDVTFFEALTDEKCSQLGNQEGRE